MKSSSPGGSALAFILGAPDPKFQIGSCSSLPLRLGRVIKLFFLLLAYFSFSPLSPPSSTPVGSLLVPRSPAWIWGKLLLRHAFFSYSPSSSSHFAPSVRPSHSLLYYSFQHRAKKIQLQQTAFSHIFVVSDQPTTVHGRRNIDQQKRKRRHGSDFVSRFRRRKATAGRWRRNGSKICFLNSHKF